MNFIITTLRILAFPWRYSSEKITKSCRYLVDYLLSDRSRQKRELGRHMLRAFLTFVGGFFGGIYGGLGVLMLCFLLIPFPLAGLSFGLYLLLGLSTSLCLWLGITGGMTWGGMAGAMASKMVTKIGTWGHHLLLKVTGGYENRFSPVNPSKKSKYEPNPRYRIQPSSPSEEVIYSKEGGSPRYNAKDLQEIFKWLYQEKQKNKNQRRLLVKLTGEDISNQDKTISRRNARFNDILNEVRALRNITMTQEEKGTSKETIRKYTVSSAPRNHRLYSERYSYTLWFKNPPGTSPTTVELDEHLQDTSNEVMTEGLEN